MAHEPLPVVEDDELAAAAADLAARLAAGPVGAFGVVKRVLAESQPGYALPLAREGRAISVQAATAEGAEGIRRVPGQAAAKV